MRCRALGIFVLAVSLYAQMASDDGRTVYYSVWPLHIPENSVRLPFINQAVIVFFNFQGTRLYRWQDGKTSLLMDTPDVQAAPRRRVAFESVSADGRLALASLSSLSGNAEWLIYRNAEPEPAIRFQAIRAAMSRNGQWIVAETEADRPNVQWFRIGEKALELVATLSNAGTVSPNVADNGTSYVVWSTNGPGLFNPVQKRFVPAERDLYAPLSLAGRYYYFRRSGRDVSGHLVDRIVRVDASSGEVLETTVTCPYRPLGGLFALPQLQFLQIADNDTRLSYSCVNSFFTYDSVSGTTVAWTSGTPSRDILRRALIRPSENEFRWWYPGDPIDEEWKDLTRFESVTLQGNLAQHGLLVYEGKRPDFIVNWGGKDLQWLGGDNGLWYLPANTDAQRGAIDTLSVRSISRPRLNSQMDFIVLPQYQVVPLSTDPSSTDLLHEDFSGFISAKKRVRPGEIVHLYLSGIDSRLVPVASTIEIRDLFQRLGSSDLPYVKSCTLVAAGSSPYGPGMYQVSFRWPADGSGHKFEGGFMTLSIFLQMSDGSLASVAMFLPADVEEPL